MTRKLECIRKNEVGQVIRAGHSFCRYAAKPLTETVCNEDKHCDRKWSPNTHYFLFYGSYFIRRHGGATLFEQGESKTVLDSGLHAVDFGFQVLVSGFSVSGSWIRDFNRHSWFFELYCGFPHMRRYEGIEKKLLSSDKERKRIPKRKEKIVLLLPLMIKVRSTLLFSQFSQRSLLAFYSTI